MYEKVDFLNLSDLVCSNYKKNNIISEFLLYRKNRNVEFSSSFLLQLWAITKGYVNCNWNFSQKNAQNYFRDISVSNIGNCKLLISISLVKNKNKYDIYIPKNSGANLHFSEVLFSQPLVHGIVFYKFFSPSPSPTPNCL